MKSVIFNIIYVLYLVTVTNADLRKYDLNNVNILDDELLAEYKKSPNVRVVYYYKNDFHRLGVFLKQLDKSAEYLTLYGVKTGIYDCNKEKHAETCDENRVEQNFYTYSNDRELIKLDMETMFDVNSIMSNILQLVLLREVPILQSKEERLEHEDKYKGSYDIIYGYQKAIGTHEHRIFMEIAYAYHDKFKFAVTTVKQSTEGLVDSKNIKDVGVWVILCKDAKSRADTCSHIKYEGNMDLANLAAYVRTLSLPLIFHFPEDGQVIPYFSDGGTNVVYLFYTRNNKKDVMSKAKIVTESFRGVAGVVCVDRNNHMGTSHTVVVIIIVVVVVFVVITCIIIGVVICMKWYMSVIHYLFQYNSDAGIIPVEGFNGETPAVAVSLKNKWNSPVFMSKKEFSNLNVYAFVYEQLKTILPEPTVTTKEEIPEEEISSQDESPEVTPDALSDRPPDQPDPEDVEQQDDQVAEAVHRARFKTQMDLDLVPTLTDKTFPKTVQVKDLLFVLFYLPFDDKSMAFLRAYGDASRKLENDTDQSLARVNCHDWTDVCGHEKVITYPVVKVYQQGKLLMNYNGLLDTDEVVKTFKLLKHAGQSNLKSVKDIQNFIGEMSVFKEVAAELKSKFAYGINMNGEGKDIAKMKFNTHLPAIIVLKMSDTLEPFTVYGGQFQKSEILKFISESTMPKMPEMTVQIFPALYSQKKPFVIAFLDDLEKSVSVKNELEKVVKTNKFHGLKFCWLSVVLSLTMVK
ncbi:hypothetical protein KUTeg_014263 [Tegillarca granosa]|uniref:Thioredoxin domain-containing protein n=1 Tax=Tegillarca granosa TaxID=220873 RepID=A0ABQ9EWG8_TEGGR|nr:hypothetical protein KUTeg_014263 [Tegillarca granosa]